MDLGNHFQHQVFCQCRHLWPVLDVRTKLDLYRWICHALAVKDTVCINAAVKEILRIGKVFIHIGCCRQISLVGCGCCNGTCIHQCYGSDLSALQLASLTVREVSGRMTDGKCIIGRCISCTKTWSAECSLHNGTCFNQVCQTSVFRQFHIDWSTCRINA